MKVKECMSDNIVWAKTNYTVQDVAKQMQEQHIGCVPVCDENNKLVGIVTDRDVVLRCVACEKDCKQTPITDIMTTDIHTVDPDDSINEAIENMSNWKVERIPVTSNGTLKGIITLGDLAKNQNVSDETVGVTTKHICCGCKNAF